MVVKTSGNKGVKRRKRYGIGKQAFLPVKQVITDHRADAAFVYAGTVFHDSGKVTAAFSLLSDLCLEWGRDLGIRDNKSREEGMRFFTFAAENTHDAHADRAGRRFEGAVVIGMHAQTAGMAAGAGKLVKREVRNNRVINFANFFRHRVEIRQKKSYHNLAGRHQPLSVWAGTGLSKGGVPAFLYVTGI